MLIDWFTVVAQIVNFLVLVALLKHFLWGRIVAAIDAREQRIAAGLADVEQKKRETEQRNEEVRKEIEALAGKREQMLADARRDAQDERNQLIQRARNDVRALETRWHEDLEREQSGFLEELKRRASAEMLAVMRRALADLASADLESCAVHTLVQKIQRLDVPVLRELMSGELTVLSAAELPVSAQQEIRAALEAQLGAPINLKFACSPAIAWGIELRSNGRMIGWTPDSYIASLEENLKAALERRTELVTR